MKYLYYTSFLVTLILLCVPHFEGYDYILSLSGIAFVISFYKVVIEKEFKK